MLNKINSYKLVCVMFVMLFSSSLFAHPGHEHSASQNLMHFAVLGVIFTAIIGAAYLMLVMLGKSNIKKTKEAA